MAVEFLDEVTTQPKSGGVEFLDVQTPSSQPAPTGRVPWSQIVGELVKREAQREASISPETQQARDLNEYLQKVNEAQVYGGVPFYGAGEAFKTGARSGRYVGGEGLTGDLLGLLGGGSAAALTLFNPVTKALSNLSPLAQAGGELVALHPEMATQSITGETPILPNLEQVKSTSVPLNILSEAYGALRREPAPILAAAATLAAPKGTIAKSFEAPISVIKEATTRSAKAIAPKITARVAPATVEQNAMAALDFTKEDVNRHIPVVTQRVAQFIEKAPKTAEEALSSLKSAEDQLYAERLEVNNSATQQGLVAKGNEAIQAAKEVLDNNATLLPEERVSILEDLQRRYGGDRTIDDGQNIQQSLNNKFSAAYENGTIDRANPTFQAEKAIRDSFANQMDQINRAITGRDETPYADIGSIIDVRGALREKLNKIEGAEATKKTGIEKSSGSVPGSRFEAGRKVVKKVLTPFQKTQLEKLDDSVSKIFKESQKQPEAVLLDQSEINALLDQYRPAPTPNALVNPPTSPVGEINPATLESFIQQSMQSMPNPIRVSPSLEAQIQALIKKIPKEFRGDPVLERRIAEEALRQGVQP